MKCKNCGGEIPDDAHFCNLCGAVVDRPQNTGSIEEMLAAGTPVSDNTEKYSSREVSEKIGKLITGGLSTIACIMIIGALFGWFDTKPLPFIIFIGVVLFVGWLEDKLPKFPAMFFAVVEVVALVVCFSIGNKIGAVASVKGGCPKAYPNITYEKAFDNYFANPTWKSLGQDEDGNEVVKFTGTCSYLGDDAIAEIKFTLFESQGSFDVSSVKINGTDLGDWGSVLIIDVFEEYEKK